MDIEGLRVDARTMVAAAPELVWTLITDVPRVGEWSPECVRVYWLDDAEPLAVGRRFRGHNRADQDGWVVTNVVTRVEPPHAFEWVVLDDAENAAHPSSIWRYLLDPVVVDGQSHTLVRHWFTHGPGESGLSWMIDQDPDSAHAIVDERTAQLLDHMTVTLARMKAVAETSDPLPAVADRGGHGGDHSQAPDRDNAACGALPELPLAEAGQHDDDPDRGEARDGRRRPAQPDRVDRHGG